MDKKIAGLLGTVAGLATMASAQAASGPASSASGTPQASSYAELLAPIPNAVALLKADDARAQQSPETGGEARLAQGYYAPYQQPYYRHHHHHHHHQNYYRRYSHHHHHHHHHQPRAVIGIPGVGGVAIGR